MNDHVGSTGRIWNINPDQVIVDGALTSTAGFEGVSILAGNGADQITFSGGLAQSFNVDAGGGADAITIGYLSQVTFASVAPTIINGGDGDDSFVWQRGSNNWGELLFGPFTSPVTLEGSTGYNTFSVDDTTRGNTSYQFYADRFYSREPTAFAVGADFNYDNMSAIGLTASNGNNSLAVYGTSSDIPVGSQATILLSGGNDTATMYPHGAQGNLTINGTIGISGGTGTDTMTFDDTGASNGINYSFSNPFGAGTQDVFGIGAAGMGYTSDFESATIKGGNGADTFNINQYKAGTPLAIYAGEGDDVLNFGNDNLPLNITSLAAFTFDGQGGSDQFNLNNRTEISQWQYIRDTGTIRADRISPIPGYLVILHEANIEEMTVNAGPAPDTFYVRANPAGTSTILNAGGGLDGLVLADSTQNVKGIQGLVRYNAGAAGGNILVSDNADTSDNIAHLTNTTLDASNGDTLFGPGGSLQFSDLVAFGAFPGLTLNLGSGVDTVYVAPNVLAQIVIDGNGPAGAGSLAGGNGAGGAAGDFLGFAFAGVTNPVFTPNGAGAGSYTFDDAARVSYSRMESTAIEQRHCTLHRRSELRRLSPVPTVYVEFSEDVSNALSVYTLELNNATSGEQVPYALMDLTYDTGTNTASFSFPGYPGGILSAGITRQQLTSV